jgi:hypothetical protein
MTPHKRHGLLTAFLIFKIVAYSATFYIYVFATDRVWEVAPNTPRWTLTVFSLFSILGIISVVAILRWMKWGFYVLCSMAVVGLAVNLYAHVSPLGAFSGLLGPVILYALLQLGGQSKAWSHLR